MHKLPAHSRHTSDNPPHYALESRKASFPGTDVTASNQNTWCIYQTDAPGAGVTVSDSFLLLFWLCVCVCVSSTNGTSRKDCVSEMKRG